MTILVLLILWQVHVWCHHKMHMMSKLMLSMTQMDEKDITDEIKQEYAVRKGTVNRFAFCAFILQSGLVVWLAVVVFERIRAL